MNRWLIITLCLFTLLPDITLAQDKNDDEKYEKIPIVFYKKKQKEWYIDDSIDVIVFPEFPVYAEKVPRFKNEKQRQKYDRLVRNVKKVLPIAKECRMMLIETYETLQTIPDPKERLRHVKAVEKSIKAQYTPRMKQLTFSQGKLLIKLIDRECNNTSYEVIKAFLGTGRATFYQIFAWTLGASLKKDFDPDKNEEDAMIERVARQVELGLL